MLKLLQKFLLGGSIDNIIQKIADIKLARMQAASDIERMYHDEELAYLEARKELALEAERNLATWWIRPAFAFIILVWLAKILIYDQVLGLGSTPAPSGIVEWIIGAVVGFYFMTRPFEKYMTGRRPRDGG